MTVAPRELSPEELRRACMVEEMGFASTADLPELTEIIGQERATRAIEFGIDIQCYGYNIFAMGRREDHHHPDLPPAESPHPARALGLGLREQL